jgi:hypothetical protein
MELTRQPGLPEISSGTKQAEGISEKFKTVATKGKQNVLSV